ncbi:MAG TPA: multiheme c-type cytochrome [Myxococcota bacterium]|nr:multiheme c-type cytochrome [Myxococcota bacterium]
MRSTRAWWALAAVAAAAAADPGTPDARGWTPGQVAANLAHVVGPASDEPVVIQLPRSLAKQIKGRTLLLYFSPSCPHCQRVAPEVARLAVELGDQATVLGIATRSASAADIADFSKRYGFTFRVVQDTDGAMASAIQASGTPSALLVDPVKGGFQIVDLWYPYVPGTEAMVRMRASGSPFSVFEPGRYLGNQACGSCHVQELESWLITHHAIAWGTLVEHDKQGDDQCVSCHVTGYGKAGGWTAGSPLTDVGCEACHGPGGPHDGQRDDASQACVQCHDADHTIAFSYSKGLPLIDHFRTNTMDAPTWREERERLEEGKVDRSLLAFGAGQNVGSAACATCHAAEHAEWKGSRHGEAMASLLPHGGESKTECVRCHATATTPGPATRTLSDYRTDEGVGCESCHGPGEAHVAAGGGKDNIVGLGESCPVCVIEAVCTSCHTKEWDPLWNLDTRLGAARHTRR